MKKRSERDTVRLSLFDETSALRAPQRAYRPMALLKAHQVVNPHNRQSSQLPTAPPPIDVLHERHYTKSLNLGG